MPHCPAQYSPSEVYPQQTVPDARQSLPDIHTPLGLLLDERLTPLECNAWLVFRARVAEDGISALLARLRMSTAR